MDVGIACADHYTIVAIEQQIAIESIGPGFDCEKESKQHRTVSDHCRRHRPTMNVVLDVAVNQVDRSGEERAQKEGEKDPILDCHIGGQCKEIEADILVVEWVACAGRYLIEEPQEDRPVVDLSPGDE